MRERRRYQRAELHCAVTLWNPHEGTVIYATTDAVSCTEFICGCTQLCPVGHEYWAVIELREIDVSMNQGHDHIALECNVEVTRSAFDAIRNQFEVLFRIKDYSVTTMRSSRRVSEPMNEHEAASWERYDPGIDKTFLQ